MINSVVLVSGMQQSDSVIHINCESHSVVSDFCHPMNCTVHGVLQARILEWVAFPFSRGSSQPRDQTQVCIAGGFSTSQATREAQTVHLKLVNMVICVCVYSTTILKIRKRKKTLIQPTPGMRTFSSVQSLSHVRLFATPWTVQCMEFSRPEYWSG